VNRAQHEYAADAPDPPGSWSLKPSLWYVLFGPGSGLGLRLATLLVIAAAVVGIVMDGRRALFIAAGAVLLAAITIAWRTIQWMSTSYGVEHGGHAQPAAFVRRGVFARSTVTVPLDRVQLTRADATFSQRLLGIGTVGIASAGTSGVEILWRHVSRPHDVLDRLRSLTVSPTIQPSRADTSGMTSAPLATRPIVLGIAGGIGSGKSAVAAAFARLGCVVIDSEVRARAALDRPDVRETLVSWWGTGILTPDGRIDRASVSKIVFLDPEQRKRLEALVHPIVRQDRAAMISDLQSSGGPGVRGRQIVIIDAPLLFEVGLDAECDAVVFVDAPREQRLARVAQTRGWSEAELHRREAAQLPVEQKRARSRFLVNNSSTLADIDAQARAVLDQVLAPEA
jgi:dephospho-CoA kinase